MYKQIIIARKDLNMSPGKLAAQVSHGSIAFLTNMIKENVVRTYDNKYRSDNPYMNRSIRKLSADALNSGEEFFYASPKDISVPFNDREYELCEPKYHYISTIHLDKDLYEQWVNGSFTKCVLEAKNKTNLLKAKAMAEELCMEEGKDFFLIHDNCSTELIPEDEDGTTLTVIGFRPMDEEIIDAIGKKYQLYV